MTAGGSTWTARSSRKTASGSSSRRRPSMLERLDHVSLNVIDRSRSIEWYRDVLGLAQQNEPTDDDEPVFMGEFGACVALFQAQTVGPARQPESSGLRHV